jgi:hypothetical protein
MTLNAGEFPPEQLKMFMSARDLGNEMDHYGDFGVNPGGLPHETFGPSTGHFSKVMTAQQSGMYNSIAKEGVKRPLTVGLLGGIKSLRNGHHRAWAQSDADPDRLMPVQYSEGLSGAEKNMSNTRNDDPTGEADYSPESRKR